MVVVLEMLRNSWRISSKIKLAFWWIIYLIRSCDLLVGRVLPWVSIDTGLINLLQYMPALKSFTNVWLYVKLRSRKINTLDIS